MLCNSIIHELKNWQKKNPKIAFKTLYIGGGNPGLLSENELDFFLNQLFACINPDNLIEKSIEFNPLDINENKIQILNKFTFDRLSLGIQTLNDSSRKIIQRIGDKKIILEKLNMAAKKFIRALSLDFIYLLPGETTDTFQFNLEKAMEFGPAHLSLYQLTLENQADFLKKCGIKKNESNFLLSENIENTEKIINKIMKSCKYVQYEVSNWARNKTEFCQHNLQYWLYRDFLGLGPGAVSMFRQKRWQNCQSVEKYCQVILQGNEPDRNNEILSEQTRRFEFFMMGFRLVNGIDIKDYYHQFKESILQNEKIKKLINEKKLNINNDNIYVNDDFKPFLNDILIELLNE